MTIQNRSLVMLALIVFASLIYGAAKFYSPSLVIYVVEQTLIQKAPPGTDVVLLRRDLKSLVDAAPNRDVKMEVLFRISSYLEKVQILTPEELKGLLHAGEPGISRSYSPVFGERQT
jgi:hypothetical protein